jgi:hypothetical protein
VYSIECSLSTSVHTKCCGAPLSTATCTGFVVDRNLDSRFSNLVVDKTLSTLEKGYVETNLINMSSEPIFLCQNAPVATIEPARVTLVKAFLQFR